MELEIVYDNQADAELFKQHLGCCMLEDMTVALQANGANYGLGRVVMFAFSIDHLSAPALSPPPPSALGGGGGDDVTKTVWFPVVISLAAMTVLVSVPSASGNDCAVLPGRGNCQSAVGRSLTQITEQSLLCPRHPLQKLQRAQRQRHRSSSQGKMCEHPPLTKSTATSCETGGGGGGTVLLPCGACGGGQGARAVIAAAHAVAQENQEETQEEETGGGKGRLPVRRHHSAFHAAQRAWGVPRQREPTVRITISLFPHCATLPTARGSRLS